MKKVLIFTFIVMLSAGCASGIKKHLTVIVEPPDAEILVIPGGEQPEQKYRSPADITVYVPREPSQAAKSRLEIKRQTFSPKIIGLQSVGEEETLKVKLEKKILYRLKFRLIRPAVSDDFSFRDRILAVSLVPGQHQFELKVNNLTQRPVKILWNRAEYIDLMNGQHTLLHSGIKSKDRNNTVPPQEIPANGSLQESVMPKNAFTYSQVLKEYTPNLLFPVDSDAAPSLKGRTFSVFLPVELDRAIIPDYNFVFQVVDVIKE